VTLIFRGEPQCVVDAIRVTFASGTWRVDLLAAGKINFSSMLYNQQLPEAVRICLQKHSVKIRPRNIQQKLHCHFIPYDNLCNFSE